MTAKLARPKLAQMKNTAFTPLFYGSLKQTLQHPSKAIIVWFYKNIKEEKISSPTGMNSTTACYHFDS